MLCHLDDVHSKIFMAEFMKLYDGVPAQVLQYGVAAWSEKIPQPSHNALLSMRYFVQVVMLVVSDKTYQKCKIGTTSDN